MAAVVSFLLFRTTRRLRAPSDRLQPNRRRAGPASGPTGPRCWRCRSPAGWSAWAARCSASGLPQGFSGQPTFEFGYVAIALALLAGRRPGGVVVAALLYGALTSGAKLMTIVTGIPLALLIVIVALAIMFVAAPELTRSIWRLRPPAPRAGTEGL